jgi:hypothetical protein
MVRQMIIDLALDSIRKLFFERLHVFISTCCIIPFDLKNNDFLFYSS